MTSVLERAKARGVSVNMLLVLEQFERDVARNPNDARAYATMGTNWHYRCEYAKALEYLDMAVRCDPCFAYALCARADLLSTCPDSVYRNAESAAKDAEQALKLAEQRGQLKQDWRHRNYLQVLAAAHAEAGNFNMAINIVNEALAFTITKAATRKLKSHLFQYESGQPIRDEHGVIG